MNVTNLSKASLDEVIDCFIIAFSDYSIKMPTARDYYKDRWKAAGVSLDLSYGMFDQGELVGFIIHAVDERRGLLTAFNTGTGVRPEFRGRKIVKAIYEYALDDLRKNGIKTSTLEVITTNEIAIKAYKSVGFKISRKYFCFTGEIKVQSSDRIELRKTALGDVNWEQVPNQEYYSWDFEKETVLAREYAFYKILYNGVTESYFIIDPKTRYLAQFDLLDADHGEWARLFSAIREISRSVKIINVDERLNAKLDYIRSIGLNNYVDQFEMELKFS